MKDSATIFFGGRGAVTSGVMEFFTDVTDRIAYEGPDSDNPLAFRWYDADRVVAGRRMEDHLRFAVCYWHSFAWDGFDIFGAGTMDRPWHPTFAAGADPMAAAKQKMDAAFEFFAKLGVPFYCFHDRDIAPEGASFKESAANLDEMVDVAAEHQQRTGVRAAVGHRQPVLQPALPGGRGDQSRPRGVRLRCRPGRPLPRGDAPSRRGTTTCCGAAARATRPCSTPTCKRELDQLARFLSMVVEHKQRIGFTGTILLEPKPFEPTKHQYDYDVAAVHAFLQKYDLADEIKVNIEVNHATLAGHDFAHEIASAVNAGIFGSIDANAGDDRLGWDVDRFPVSVEQMTLGMLEILRGGGFTTGGLNFDSKLRRQSTDRTDLFYAHIGGMDTMATGLAGGRIDRRDRRARHVPRRALRRMVRRARHRRSWPVPALRDLHARAMSTGEPTRASGHQEMLENLVARHIERAR